MKISESHPLDIALYGMKKKSSEFIPVIIRIVCKETGISRERLLSTTRKREIVQARQIAMLLSYRVTKASLATIGDEIGGKDHATVLHAKKTIMNLTETEKDLRTMAIRCINHIWGFSSDILVCEICGSASVQQKGWVDPNINVFKEWVSDHEDTDCWCNDCKGHVKLISNKIFQLNDGQNTVEAIPDRVQESN